MQCVRAGDSHPVDRPYVRPSASSTVVLRRALSAYHDRRGTTHMETSIHASQPTTAASTNPTTPLSEAERRLLLTAATRRMATKPESTRRLEPRYMVPPGCQVSVRSVGGFLKGKPLTVTVRDISRSGVAILNDGPLAVGTDLEVQVIER